MPARIDYPKLSAPIYRTLFQLQTEIEKTGLDPKTIDLIKIRASQINGCAFCIDMHTIDARARGESEQRIYALNAWREGPFFTDKERAALELTESVTRISETHVPDEIFEAVKQHYTDQEIVNLTWAIIAINAWNRLAITFRAEPGHYKAQAHAKAS
ncbi:MAG TPA: carboxymuconolactone decarboxylase family protein [Terriglobales bacterium]|jgi:AhpD family alkylhydroperoxidase|nr:carboxymuconolactone decarboxylase family protein [Terriglobales bacterium]